MFPKLVQDGYNRGCIMMTVVNQASMMFPDNSKRKILSFICFSGRAPERVGSYQARVNRKLIHYRLHNPFDSRILPAKHKNLETLLRDRTGLPNL